MRKPICLIFCALMLLSVPVFADWQQAGLEGQNVTALAEFSGDAMVWYAGTYTVGDDISGNVYKYEDPSVGWVLKSDGLPLGVGILSISIDPSNASIVYAGLDGAGIYKSTDGGESWFLNGLGNLSVRGIGIDPYDPSIVFAATDAGIYRTVDGGTNWLSVVSAAFASPDARGISFNPPDFDLEPLPSETDVVYAATADGLYKSSDGGINWGRLDTADSGLTSHDFNTVAIDAEAPSVLYAGTADTGIFKSSDGGASWSAANSGLSGANVLAIAFHPTVSSTLLVGTADGGVFRSDSAGQVWRAYNGGNPSLQVNAVGFLDPQFAFILAGTSTGVVSYDLSLPDLVISAVSGRRNGENIDVSYTVKNVGSANAGEFRVSFFLSTDSTITTGDHYIGSQYVGYIGAGEEKTFTATVKPPINIAGGPFYIGAYADLNNGQSNITEADETNNSLAGNIIADYIQDLSVTAVSGYRSGENIVVTYTLKSGANAGEFRVSFFLSTDSTITTGDHYIGSQYVGYIGAGEEKTFTATVKPPINIAGGPFYIGAYADLNNGQSNITEADETNNGLAGNIIADYIQDLSITAVSGYRSGENIVVTYTVKSGANAGNFYVCFFLSADSTITFYDDYIGDQKVEYIGAGEEKTFTATVKPPQNIQGGPFYIGAYADRRPGSSIVKEADETNNGLAGNIIADYIQDLSITAVSGYRSGENIVVTYTVKSGANAGNFYVCFFLSADSTITFYDDYIGDQKVEYIGAGEEKTFTATVKPPQNIQGGPFYIGAYADRRPGSSIVKEADETNNGLAGNIICWGDPSLCNKSPLANAGPDRTIECAGGGTAVTLDGSGSSDPDGDALSYSWTGAFGTAAGVSPTVSLPLGTNTITLTVNDGKGGTSSDTVTITISDTTAPSTTAMNTGAIGNNGWYVTPTAVALSSTDSCSGVAEIRYGLNGVDSTASGNAAEISLNEGINILSFYAVDNAGNSEASRQLEIKVDYTSPVITITGVQDGATYELGSVPTASYTVTDAASGVASSSANLTGGDSIGLGDFTYTVTAIDNAGNSSDARVSYTVIATATGLIDVVNQLFASGLIDGQMVNSLVSMLQNAANAPNGTSADNKLGAFINHVNAQSGAHIDPSAAQILINAAQYIINNN